MRPESGTRSGQLEPRHAADGRPGAGDKGTDLRFYRGLEIDPPRFGIRLPCVVVGAYGYHYI